MRDFRIELDHSQVRLLDDLTWPLFCNSLGLNGTVFIQTWDYIQECVQFSLVAIKITSWKYDHNNQFGQIKGWNVCQTSVKMVRICLDFRGPSVKQLRRLLNVWQIESVRMPFSVTLLVNTRTAVFASIKRKTYDEAAKLPYLANCVIRLCFWIHSFSSHSAIFHQQLWYFVISK